MSLTGENFRLGRLEGVRAKTDIWVSPYGDPKVPEYQGAYRERPAMAEILACGAADPSAQEVSRAMRATV
jgi:hypothetical protein